MTTDIIHVSQDYKLHITVSPVGTPLGDYHLKVQSQLLSAKDPAGLQTKYAVTLPRRQLLELAYTIIEGVKP
jgi:hypothetical protein